MDLKKILDQIETPKETWIRHAEEKWNSIAKPLRSFGRLEDIVSQLSGIMEQDRIQIKKRCAIVMCADNGVVKEGVTQTDSSVTLTVAKEIAENRGNINRIAESVSMDVYPVDIGIDSDELIPGIVDCKIRRGTGNILYEDAVTEDEAEKALKSGVDLVRKLAGRGYQAIAAGEMGIGNTTTATCVASLLCDLDPEQITGRGAGLSEEAYANKRRIVGEIVSRNRKYSSVLEIMRKVGGLDILGMTGIFLGGALYRIPVIIDGFISLVSAYCAVQIQPKSRFYMIPSHMSKEPAAKLIYSKLDLTPVIYADLALGEGTGAALMFPLLDAALTLYNTGSSFKDMNIPAYKNYTENMK